MQWTHMLCDTCWEALKPYQQPYRIVDQPERGCCRCGLPSRSGIFVREHPDNMICCSCTEDEETGNG